MAWSLGAVCVNMSFFLSFIRLFRFVRAIFFLLKLLIEWFAFSSDCCEIQVLCHGT